MAEEFISLEDDDQQVQPAKEQIKHLLVGSPRAVTRTIQTLHLKGYSEVNDWSKAVPAGELGRAGEVVRVLLKQVSLD